MENEKDELILMGSGTSWAGHGKLMHDSRLCEVTVDVKMIENISKNDPIVLK